jgi:Mrp family chromosome partitioning ATPase
MDGTDYLRAFARRWVAVAICLAVSVAAAVGYGAMATRQYRATVKFIVVDKAGSVDTKNAYQGSLLSQQLAGTFAQLVGTTEVAQAVAGQLPVTGSAAAVQSRISGTAVLGTSLFTASVTDTSPQGAQVTAKALASVVPDYMASVQSTRGLGHSPVVVKIVEGPQLPSAPISPRPARNVAVALVLGLLAAVTTILALERLDSSTRSVEQLATATGLQPLGEVPTWRRVREASVALRGHSSPERDEAFRRLRARLLSGEPPNLPASVLIVSARPREGRSSTACGLGMAIAAGGSSVLLVDADLRPPSSPGIAEYFGIRNEPGLFDLLASDSDSDSDSDVAQGVWAYVWSCAPMLDVLPRGSIQAHTDAVGSSAGGEVGPRLESSNVGAILKDLEGSYDVVIIDTPPLLSRADGLIIASFASSAILVAERGRTSLDDVRKAMDDLRSVDASVRGALVTFASGRPSVSSVKRRRS